MGNQEYGIQAMSFRKSILQVKDKVTIKITDRSKKNIAEKGSQEDNHISNQYWQAKLTSLARNGI
ncbi:hypothetical protein A0256_03340 [Mucilaginibacter sp. PAMC 26640]|nr:hypothetical protein A0256_03340 [Mucilaginibacter sp. PAMC 26640]